MKTGMRMVLNAFARRAGAIRGVSGAVALLTLTFCCLLLPVARAQDATWTAAGSGLWTEAANWTPNVAPSNNPTVWITNAVSKTVTVDAAAPAGNLTVTNLTISAPGDAANALLLNNTSPLSVAGTLQVGWTNGGAASVGALVVDGGQLVTTNAAKTLVAYVGGAVTLYNGPYRIGTATVSNGMWLANEIRVRPLGKLTVAGGVLTTTASGYGCKGTGTMLLDAMGVISNTGSFSFKTLIVSNGVLNTSVLNVGDQYAGGQVGGSASVASMSLAGGTVNAASSFCIGRIKGTDKGTVVMTGGQLVTGYTQVGSYGVGTMTVSNGTWRGTQTIVANYTNSVGTLTLAGGSGIFSYELSVGRSVGDPGTGVHATGTVNVIAGNLAVTNAGGTALMRVGFGTGGHGTFTLKGGAVCADQFMAINGANSVVDFAGGTLSTRAATVNNGSAFVVGDGVGAATLNLVGGTNVNMFTDGVVINTNGSLSVAGADAIGSAQFNGDLTLRQNARLDWNYNATTQDWAVVTGSVTLASSATVNLTSLDASTPKTIPLLTAAGGFVGTPSAWPLSSAAGSLYQAQLSGNTLLMVRRPKGTLLRVF